MTLEQVKLLRETHMAEVTDKNGNKSTASGFMHLYLDGSIDIITSRDCVVFDDDNKMVHCIAANVDANSQGNHPVSIYSAEYAVIQEIEAVYDTTNLEKVLTEGFLSSIDDKKKEFIRQYAKTFANQALQPSKAYPYYPQDAKVVPMGNNAYNMVRSDGLAYPTTPATAGNKVILGKYTKNIMAVDGATAYRTFKTRTGEDYKQPAKIVPIIGSAQAGNDENNMPNKCENYVDYKLEVENTCDEDCWVRIFLALPKVLDYKGEATFNILHWNVYYVTTNPDCPSGDFYNWGWTNTPWPPDHGGEWNNFDVEINGIEYTVYPATYYTKLKPGKTTEPSLKGYYLDKNVMVEDLENGGTNYYIYNNTAGVDYANEAALPKASIAKEGMYARVGADQWYKFTNGAWVTTDEVPEKRNLGDLNKMDLMLTAVQIMPCSSSRADNAHDALNEKFGLPSTKNNPFKRK